MTGATAAAVDAAGLVRRVLGDGALAGDPEAWATRGTSPGAVALPESTEAAAELLRAAATEGVRVLPAGRGTWLGGGDPPGPVELVISTRRMDRIVQYEPADLTLTAGAGIGLDVLSGATAENGQWLPMDPPGHPGGSLGATLATASSGFFATKYGAIRDLVLGLTLVTGDGRTLRLGGRVVKNVAGFDLVRLVVGSWGTLGLVTEATVRLYPAPRAVVVLRATAGSMEELVDAARVVAGGRVLPARLELREAPLGEDGGREAVLSVALHGSEASVEAEAARLRLDVPTLEVAYDELPLPEPARDPDLVVRLRAPRGGLGELVGVARALGRLEGGRNVLDDQPVVHRVDPLAGTVRIVVPNVRTDGRMAGLWRDRIEDLRRTMTERGGGLTVESAPEVIVRGPGAQASPRKAEAVVMRRIREHFDPERVLARGRADSEGVTVPDEGTGEGVEWA